MDRYTFQIAGAAIHLESEPPLPMSENFAPFVIESADKADYHIVVRAVDTLPSVQPISFWQMNQAKASWQGRPCILHRMTESRPPYLMEVQQAEDTTLCLYQSGRNLPVRVENLFNSLGLESVLWHFDTMILHSSFIRWQGKGILFSAPCGTGKSTQADLWQKYQGADILNGDRSGLRKIDGQWIAHGLPYAGTSGIYRQEKAPIAAIVLLEQAPENTIVPMNPAQALRRIWPEVSLHRWDRDFTEKGLALLTDLVTIVPFYKLSCRPDEGAVNLLRDTLNREVKQ